MPGVNDLYVGEYPTDMTPAEAQAACDKMTAMQAETAAKLAAISKEQPMPDTPEPVAFTKEMLDAATAETERLTHELDITNADHIALWLEAKDPYATDAWLSVQIAEAYERTRPADDLVRQLVEAADLLLADMDSRPMPEIKTIGRVAKLRACVKNARAAGYGGDHG